MMTSKTAPTLDRDARALHEALTDLMRVLQFRDRDRICCHDLSVTQCHALRVLVSDGPLTLNALAGELYLDKSTASRVLGALERKGYARRGRDPADGRALRVEATQRGRALYDRIEADLIDQQRELIARFDPEVRQAMVALIGNLARAAASSVVASQGSCCLVS